MSDNELSILPADIQPETQLVSVSVFSKEEVLQQVKVIHDIMSAAMQKDKHYGNIPGVSKPTLFKAGAEKLGLTFRLTPKYEIQRIDHQDGHCEYIVTCSLYHITGGFVGQGVGSCSTLESKYRYRNAQRVCPVCGVAAIIKGKVEYGGGWLCYKKKDGCGAKFVDDDKVITDQIMGKIENPDIADQYNTVLKMAKKRAYVDAILTATAASDIFTQDIGDNKKDDQPPKNKTTEEKKDFDFTNSELWHLVQHECISQGRRAAIKTGLPTMTAKAINGMITRIKKEIADWELKNIDNDIPF